LNSDNAIDRRANLLRKTYFKEKQREVKHTATLCCSEKATTIDTVPTGK